MTTIKLRTISIIQNKSVVYRRYVKKYICIVSKQMKSRRFGFVAQNINVFILQQRWQTLTLRKTRQRNEGQREEHDMVSKSRKYLTVQSRWAYMRTRR